MAGLRLCGAAELIPEQEAKVGVERSQASTLSSVLRIGCQHVMLGS